MAFEWHRMHKHEEQIENDIYDRVCTQVSEYSPIRSGFSDLFDNLEI